MSHTITDHEALVRYSDLVTVVLNPRRTISKALAELRAEGGPDLDIPALAEQTGVPAEWLYQLDQARPGPVDLEDLERLCCILGRSPNDLLGYEADE
jgi:DNA-binding Xre family transcriptional regulator